MLWARELGITLDVASSLPRASLLFHFPAVTRNMRKVRSAEDAAKLGQVGIGRHRENLDEGESQGLVVE